MGRITLLAWAATQGTDDQRALAERLFRAYFTEGGNVADHDTLAGCTADVGLDPDDAREVLGTGGFAAEVEADLRAAVERGITAVPTFVLADRLALPGAQDVDTMVTLLERARDRLGGEG